MISGTRYQLTAEIDRQSNLADRIARLQTDISSQTRLQAPSDDPAAAARVGDIRRTQADQMQWKANVDAASALAAQVDTTLASMATSMNRALELMTNAKTATLSDSDRAAIATELRGIADDLNTYAAQKDSRGQALFPDGDPLAVPVGDGLALAATGSRASVFSVSANGSSQDMAAIMTAAADAVTQADPATRASAMADSLTAINAASAQVSSVQGVQGVRAARLQATADRLDASATTLAAERSTLEDTDITRSVAELQAKLLTLQAAQATFARLSHVSLFDQIG